MPRLFPRTPLALTDSLLPWSYISRSSAAIESGEPIEPMIVLAAIGELIQSSEFVSDQQFIDEYVATVNQLLESE